MRSTAKPGGAFSLVDESSIGFSSGGREYFPKDIENEITKKSADRFKVRMIRSLY